MYILVLGYGWSGSSAVVDLLNEYDQTYQIPVEFRLIKDPYGMMDLRYNLVDRWDPLNVDISVKKFLWHVKYLNQKRKRIPPRVGLGYQTALHHDFENAVNKFISEIAPTQYDGFWFFFDYLKSGVDLLFERVLLKLHLKKNKNENMFYSNISGDYFDQKAQECIESIFAEAQSKSKFLILDQAVPAQDIEQADHYFKDYKVIVVDRDVRDNYCDLVNNHALIGEEIRKSKDNRFFIDWYLRLRKNRSDYSESSNVKFVSFEKLVFEYEETVREIEDFVGLSSDSHKKIKEYFNPDNSKRNIGIWKKYERQEIISDLKEKLADYISEYAE